MFVGSFNPPSNRCVPIHTSSPKREHANYYTIPTNSFHGASTWPSSNSSIKEPSRATVSFLLYSYIVHCKLTDYRINGELDRIKTVTLMIEGFQKAQSLRIVPELFWRIPSGETKSASTLQIMVMVYSSDID